MVPFHRSTRSGLAHNGKVRLQPQHSTEVSPQQHGAGHEAFLSLGWRSLVGSRRKEVSDGVRRCQVLWNAAVTVFLCVIASVSALRGLPGRDQESVYHHDVYPY